MPNDSIPPARQSARFPWNVRTARPSRGTIASPIQGSFPLSIWRESVRLPGPRKRPHDTLQSHIDDRGRIREKSGDTPPTFLTAPSGASFVVRRVLRIRHVQEVRPSCRTQSWGMGGGRFKRLAQTSIRAPENLRPSLKAPTAPAKGMGQRLRGHR
jgi:hypothetical protein